MPVYPAQLPSQWLPIAAVGRCVEPALLYLHLPASLHLALTGPRMRPGTDWRSAVDKGRTWCRDCLPLPCGDLPSASQSLQRPWTCRSETVFASRVGRPSSSLLCIVRFDSYRRLIRQGILTKEANHVVLRNHVLPLLLVGNFGKLLLVMS